MKKNMMLFCCILFSLTAWANVRLKEIKSNSEWDAVFKQAELQNKYIFVFVYTDWCGYCKKMKKEVFTSDSLYMNDDFISIKVNGESDFGSSVAYIYNVSGYPSSLFLDENENLLNSSHGYVDELTFQHQVESLAIYKQRASVYQGKFEQGTLDKIGKLEYLSMVYKAGLEEKSYEIAQVYLREINNNELLEEQNSFVIKSFITDVKSKHFVFLVNNEQKIIEKYGAPFYDVFIKNVFTVNLDKAIEQNNIVLVDDVVSDVLVEYLDEEVFEEGKTGTYQMYYSKTNNWSAYNREVLTYYAKNENTDYLCDRALLVVNDFFDSKDMLNYASGWLAIAEKKHDNYRTQILYASILTQKKEYKEALKKAKKAKKMAETDEDITSVDELIGMIELKIETK